MALPKQVQKQLDEVEELEKQLEAQGEEVEAKPEVKKKKTSKKAKAEDTEVEVTDDEPIEEPVAVEATPADDSKEEVSESFKQKYATLRGKYDAEVPRLHQQVKELTDQMNAIRHEAEAAKKAEAEKPKEKVSYVTDADREEYGDDLIDFQRRVAKEASQEYEDRFEQQAKVIEQLQQQISNTGSQVGEVGFTQKLNALVPGFDQLDNDERWVAWLNEYDPMTRGPRRDQAQSAFNSGDAEAVAHYVGLFRESINEPVANGKSDRQTELEKQVTPSRSASTVTNKSSSKDSRVYSEKELNNAWTKIRTLNTQGKYDDAEKLEAELTAAYMEGRVK
jgi:uncharacterized protein YukE|tara:strand:+ start:1090 stop:2094 length:1005 start_codon:yes stop_codon:yes gene_type:complete